MLHYTRLTDTALAPVKAHKHDCGWDVFSDLKEPVTLYPLCHALIPTGLQVWVELEGYRADNLKLPIEQPMLKVVSSDLVTYTLLPIQYHLWVTPKSGRAYKEQLQVLNTPGLIDHSYTGELKVILQNQSSQKNIIIEPFQKIAQIVPFSSPLFTLVEHDTKRTNDSRNTQGFGSTGI